MSSSLPSAPPSPLLKQGRRQRLLDPSIEYQQSHAPPPSSRTLSSSPRHHRDGGGGGPLLRSNASEATLYSPSSAERTTIGSTRQCFLADRLASAKASLEAYVAKDDNRHQRQQGGGNGASNNSPRRGAAVLPARSSSPSRGLCSSPHRQQVGGSTVAGFEHLNHSIEWFVAQRLAIQQQHHRYHLQQRSGHSSPTSPPVLSTHSPSDASLDAAFLKLSAYIQTYYSKQEALHAVARYLTVSQGDRGYPSHLLRPEEGCASAAAEGDRESFDEGGDEVEGGELAARRKTAQLGASLSLVLKCCGVLVRQLTAAAASSSSSAAGAARDAPTYDDGCDPLDALQCSIFEACQCIATHLYVMEDIETVRDKIEAVLLPGCTGGGGGGSQETRPDSSSPLRHALMGSGAGASESLGALHRALRTLLFDHHRHQCSEGGGSALNHDEESGGAPGVVSFDDGDPLRDVTQSWPTFRELLTTDPLLHMPQLTRTLRHQQKQVRVLSLWHRQCCRSWEQFSLRSTFRAWRDCVQRAMERQNAMVGMQRSLTHAQQTAEEKTRLAKQAQTRLMELQGTSDRDRRELLRERELERVEASELRSKVAEQAEETEALKKRVEALEAKNIFLTSELHRKEEKLQKFFHKSRLINGNRAGGGGGGRPASPSTPASSSGPSSAASPSRASLFHFCEPENLMYDGDADCGDGAAMVEGIAELLEDLLDHLAPVPKRCFVFTDALHNPKRPANSSPQDEEAAAGDDESGRSPISLTLSSFEDLLVFLLQRQRERIEAMKDVEQQAEEGESEDEATAAMMSVSSRLQSALGHSLDLLGLQPSSAAKPRPPADHRRNSSARNNGGGDVCNAVVGAPSHHRRSTSTLVRAAIGSTTGTSTATDLTPPPLRLVATHDAGVERQGGGGGTTAGTTNLLARRVVEAALDESTAQPNWLMMLCLMVLEPRDDDSALFSKALGNMCLATDILLTPQLPAAAAATDCSLPNAMGLGGINSSSSCSEDEGEDTDNEAHIQKKIADRNRRRLVRALIFASSTDSGGIHGSDEARRRQAESFGCATSPPAPALAEKQTAASNVRLLSQVLQTLCVFDPHPITGESSYGGPGSHNSPPGKKRSSSSSKSPFPAFCSPREEPSRLAELRRRVRDGWYRGCALERLQKHISLAFMTETARQSSHDVRTALEASMAVIASRTRCNSSVAQTPTGGANAAPNDWQPSTRRRRQSTKK